MKPPPPPPFRSANPHALACILEASETRSIIAATDIFDIHGLKLWARDRPVSAELQRRLADRCLREPLETSLTVQDGLSARDLCLATEQLALGDGPLAPLLRPHARRLLSEIAGMPLQPAVQLLLSVAQSVRPASHAHAVAAMAVAGALALGSGADTAGLRSALLGGLLHDLGEIYLDPRHTERDVDREVDFLSYQQLVVHPHIGRLIVQQLTAYPASVARAVGEHHERLDGSGYPHALTAEAISPLGRLLAVTDATLCAMTDRHASLLHASVALRAVPGEFDLACVGRVSHAAARLSAPAPVMDTADICARLHALDAVLASAWQAAQALARPGDSSGLQGATALAQFLIQRLRTGWNESGLWAGLVTDGAQAAEVEVIEDELYRRLRAVRCATLMRAGDLVAPERQRVLAFCDGLAMGRG